MTQNSKGNSIPLQRDIKSQSPFENISNHSSKPPISGENTQIKAAAKHRSTLSLTKSISFSMAFDSMNGNSKGPTGVPKRSEEISAALEDKIQHLGGDRPVHSVLVANNGLAAVKFIRSIRNWAYKTFGDEHAVRLIAMATPEDMKADAEHIRLVDQFVEVPGGRNANNYANVQLIVSVAIRTGVDAVWPGWGHASEKPELPELLSETPSGIRFVGPPSHAMSALGDKIGSTILAQSAGVPTLPWSGDGVKISYAECPEGNMPKDVYDKACIHSLSEALECCNRIGYPVMLKASWGGGGKGIRKVMNDDDVRLVFRQVQGEVPGSPIFAMKLAPQSRHLEVQLLCDMHGNVCSLFSRDCSVQRRHQKIVEEGPVTAAPPEVLQDMERCARALARAVGYVGAATVEYLYALESGKYCFLELNPRLQVEHPVTEWISGVNIPACQLLIAQGVPLHRIPDIRRLFNKPSEGTDEIDFENAADRQDPSGHVLAVRITAENANAGFKPTAGTVDEIAFRSTPDVWGYFSVKGGGAIHEYSDSQFGHLFAKGDSRESAIRAMVVALKEIRIRGEIRTNADYVCELIQTSDFVENLHHTGWLDSRIAAQITSGRPPWHLSVVCGAVLRSMEHANARMAEYLGYLEKGQLPPARISLVTTTEEFVVDGTKYAVKVVRTGPQSIVLHLNNTTVEVVARKLNDGGVLIQLDGASHVVHAEEEPAGTRLAIGTYTCLLSNEHDPSAMTALSTGKLVRYLVEDGGHVLADKPYAEMEVMKMVMTLLAPAAGNIHFQLPEGSVLSPGQLIARLDLDNPSAVRRAEPFTGGWPELRPPVITAHGIGTRFRDAFEAAQNVLAGYQNNLDSVVADLLATLDDPALGLVQWNEVYGVVSSRLPAGLASQLENIAEDCAWDLEQAKSDGAAHAAASGEHDALVKDDIDEPLTSTVVDGAAATAAFAASELLFAMEDALAAAAPTERAALAALLEPLQDVARSHAKGKEEFARNVATKLLETYLEVEERFESDGKVTEQEVIDALRRSHADSLQRVVDIVLSHNGLAMKSELVLRIMGSLVLPAPDKYRKQLRRFAALMEPGTFDVSQRAQQLLEHSLLGELRTLVARALSGLDMFSEPLARELIAGGDGSVSSPGGASNRKSTKEPFGRRPTVMEGLYAGLGNISSPTMQHASMESRIAMLVEAPAAVEDALASFLLDTNDVVVRQRTLLTYIKRIYYPFLLHEPRIIAMEEESSILLALWAYEDASPSPDAPSSSDGVHGRLGGAVVIPALSCLPDAIAALMQARSKSGLAGELADGTLHVVLASHGEGAFALTQEAYDLLKTIDVGGYTPSDCEDARRSVDPKRVASAAAAQVASLAPMLQSANFSAVSVMSKRGQLAPLRTVLYRRGDAPSGGYGLVPVMSVVEPPMASALELSKLTSFAQASYSCSRNRQWHIYTVAEKKSPQSMALKRVFLRGVVRQLGRPDLLAATYSHNAVAAATAAIEEVEQTFVGALNELQRMNNAAAAGSDSSGIRPDWSHVYLDVLSPIALHDPRDSPRIAAALRSSAGAIAQRCSTMLRKTAVASWEIKIRVPGNHGAWRIVVSVPTGHEGGEDCVDVYREGMADGIDRPAEVLPSRGPVYVSQDAAGDGRLGPLHATPVLAPYLPLERLQQKRLAARRHKTTYCYDFPAVFENALREMWAERAAAGEPHAVPPATAKLVDVQELLPAPGVELSFRHRTPLVPSSRPISQNSVGVVAWILTLRTPECPHGRQVVAVANDITHSSGAFGPLEDAMFRAATEFALEEKLPVLYLAANSGARVGLANEIKQCARVCWNNPDEPNKGFKYLYLTQEDYDSIAHRAGTASLPLKARRVQGNDGQAHWELTDIIGGEDGLGVECLSGSGAIAGVYSKAFREGFTITLVSGRTVGIGAYLARLGRRCIQRSDQPIILTGYAALNKLLGREVYTSHMQLGGPKVMGANGVSHHVVEDDLAGVLCMLRWLSYTAARTGEAPPRLPSSDPDTRLVAYAPGDTEKLDARKAIAGHTDPVTGAWAGGLFDKGSWTEAHPGWARTVVTGRARLGGMPVGVIAVEVSTVMLNLPADPGMPDSSERVIPQAGQVWFPDSALKTAQSMEEFDLEGLPLFILANWRGFSGGQRDLFEGVLQAGSLIVENLRVYHQPVVMYVPPGCELRGGAWVVIDSQINIDQLESYADPGARGGVLEPEGVVEIKFRAPELLAMMHRIDPTIAMLKRNGAPDADIKARETALMPVYLQIALAFAQMHDTPVRMLAKGVLRGIIPWKTSRGYFVGRLRRRLAESALVKHIASADDVVGREDALSMLRAWFATSHVSSPRDHSMHSAHDGEGAAEQSSNPLEGIELAPWPVSSSSNATDVDHDTLWQNDAAFVSWVESASGAARIAMELKALRQRAASRIVQELSTTAEGTEGLVKGLEAAIKENPSLVLQLRSLVSK